MDLMKCIFKKRIMNLNKNIKWLNITLYFLFLLLFVLVNLYNKLVYETGNKNKWKENKLKLPGFYVYSVFNLNNYGLYIIIWI